MNALNILLDKAKEIRSLPSDNALATTLEVSRQRVSNWRNGVNYPDAIACARIAEITGEPLAKVIGIVGEARALSKEEKQVWRRLATAAAIAVITLTAAGTGLTKTPENKAFSHQMPIMLKLRRFLQELWPQPHAYA